MTNRNWERLAEAVQRRRAELGLSQRALAERGPLSRDRVQKIEGALRDDYSLTVLTALERALGWQTGSVEAVLAGGEPVAAEPGDLTIEHAPGVREHLLPPGVAERLGDAADSHTLEVSVPGEEGVLIVTWTKRLPPDLLAMTEDIKAQSRLLSRRAQVQRQNEPSERDPRNGTDG
ncbi:MULTISPECIES: helix-turn-helix transcriptional regulator [Actinocorallia]